MHPGISTISYLKKQINIEYNNQTAGDVACLDNQKCVVKFNTVCLIIDLNPLHHYESKVFNLKEHKIFFSKILPIQYGSFDLFDGDHHFVVDEQLHVRKQQGSHAKFIYFSGSREVFNIVYQACISLTNPTFEGVRFEPVNKDKAIADVQSTAILSNSVNTIQLLDLKTGNKSSINIPNKIQLNQKQRFNIYKINNKQAILGRNTKQVLYPYKKHFVLQLINLQQNKVDHLITFQESQGYFTNLKKEQSLIALVVDNYGKQIIVYNYEQRVCAWRHKLSHFRYELPKFDLNLQPAYQIGKRFSSNLKHYVELEKVHNKYKEYKLVHYKQIYTKKIYFHLMLQSKILQTYGQMLAIQLFKVFLI